MHCILAHKTSHAPLLHQNLPKMKWNCIVLLLCALCLSDVLGAAKKRYPDPKTKAASRPKPIKLNTDLLPTLQEILDTLGLTKYIKDFVKMGVTETRLLVRLSAMDFRMMSLEFDGITSDEITRLKDEIAALIIKATVIEEVVRPELAERSKLAYGRVYIPDSVQSFEYVVASFGGPPPIGKHKLAVPDSIHGCESDTNDDYSGSIVAVMRGNCTFLLKAQNAKKLGAAGIIVVNTEDRLDPPSSGLGIDKNVTDRSVLALNDFPVLTFANTSWAKIKNTVDMNKQAGVTTYLDIVPLKCKSGGVCAPLLDEEKNIQDEVSWGTVRVRSAIGQGSQVRSFDFLTSNFGSQLPTNAPLSVVFADPIDACSPLINEAVATEAVDGASAAHSESRYTNRVVVAHRGGCRFDTKALHAQHAGARLLVVIDIEDNALQRVGGMPPDSGFVGIPSIILTAAAGEHLKALSDAAAVLDISDTVGSTSITMELLPARDSSGADTWIELAFTEWHEDPSQRALQLEGRIQKFSELQQKGSGGTGSREIVAWLHRRMDEIVNKNKKNMDTDA